jgi:hypothetical protein
MLALGSIKRMRSSRCVTRLYSTLFYDISAPLRLNTRIKLSWRSPVNSLSKFAIPLAIK